MELRHIDIANLCVSPANMRGKGRPDIANILPSIRTRGILVPLIVREVLRPSAGTSWTISRPWRRSQPQTNKSGSGPRKSANGLRSS